MPPQREQTSTDWMFQRDAAQPAHPSTERLPALKTPQPAQTNRGWPMKLVIWLMTATVVAIVLVIGAMLASETLVKPMVGERVERDLGAGVQTFVDQELAALPAPVDEPQEYRVSEGELNRRIAAQPDLGPLDDATAVINADGVVVHLRAYRLAGAYRAQVVASDGAARIQGGSLSGPLSYVIPFEDLERVANEAILASLVASNVQVTDVTLVDGEIVLTIEPTGAGNDVPSG